MPNNYFSSDFDDNYLDHWEGGTNGCSDELGVWGGPIDLSPRRSQPPEQYGPRK